MPERLIQLLQTYLYHAPREELAAHKQPEAPATGIDAAPAGASAGTREARQ